MNRTPQSTLNRSRTRWLAYVSSSKRWYHSTLAAASFCSQLSDSVQIYVRLWCTPNGLPSKQYVSICATHVIPRCRWICGTHAHRSLAWSWRSVYLASIYIYTDLHCLTWYSGDANTQPASFLTHGLEWQSLQPWTDSKVSGPFSIYSKIKASE